MSLIRRTERDYKTALKTDYKDVWDGTGFDYHKVWIKRVTYWFLFIPIFYTEKITESAI
jgi:hypothetical protein